MHMPRQVVGSERGKANPVKRLRAHTSTLAARPYVFNSFRVSTGMKRFCAKRDSPSA
jgi:hypothetical protein